MKLKLIRDIIFPISLFLFALSSQASNKLETVIKEEHTHHFIEVAKSMLNTKYSFGGNNRQGIDCSGLVKYIFNHALGVKLYGPAREIAIKGQKIPKEEAFKGTLKTGDLLFFNTNGKSYSHVGIAIGQDKFIHASSTMKKVVISSINNNYYKKRLELIKRI